MTLDDAVVVNNYHPVINIFAGGIKSYFRSLIYALIKLDRREDVFHRSSHHRPRLDP